MNYKAIFFDLDGTLLNTLGDLTAACNYMLEKKGYPLVNSRNVMAALGNGIKKLVERVLPEGISDEEYHSSLADFEKYYQQHLDIKTYPYPGICELLKKLKAHNYKIVIVSNKFQKGVKHLSKKFFDGLIDLALGPDEVLKTKPDLSMINYALKTLKLSKDEVLYIGDSGVDVITSKLAGFKMLTVTWGFRTKAELSQSFDDLVFVDEASAISDYLKI